MDDTPPVEVANDESPAAEENMLKDYKEYEEEMDTSDEEVLNIL